METKRQKHAGRKLCLQMEENKKIYHIKYRKYLAVLALGILVISLIPVFAVAIADRATGDDWAFGRLTHLAWIETHSWWEVFLAACRHVKNIYFSWQGTWFSVFLFTLQPEAFSHGAYWIVPYIMVFLLVTSISFALYQFLVRVMRMPVWDYLLMDAILLAVCIHFVPNKPPAIFWYNGAVHYTVALALALFSIGYALRYEQTLRKRNLAGCAIAMTLLGGMNYLAAFFALLLVILIMISFYKKTKKIVRLALPIALEMAGLLVSALAPGNAVRGGEGYAVTIGGMLWAVVESFRQGCLGIVQYVKEYPIVMAAMIVAAIILWDILQELVEKEELHFPLPGVMLFYFFGTYCAVYWPASFVGGLSAVSDGVPNTYYWAFVLMLFCSMVYGLGWLAEKKGKQYQERKQNRTYILYLAGMAFALLIVAVNYRNVKESTFYMSYHLIKTGQAQDYKERMAEVTELLLDEQEKNVIVPGIFEDETPLMNMPITTDENEWTNRIVSAFFGKDSVIALPREIYEKRLTE